MPKRPRRASPSNTYRFFVAPTAIRGRDVHIDDGALLHQLGNVLRLQPADRVLLLDDTGSEYTVVIRSIGRQEVTGHVEACVPARGEPRLQLALYVALLKGDRFELVLQKGTEIGASRFVPLITARSLADQATGTTAARRERWERIIRESAEQSGRGRLPVLEAPQPFRQACVEATGEARTMLLWEGQDAQSLADALAAGHDDPRPLALFSGPEGGWTEDEVAAAIGYNMIPVSLGPRILRAETAPIAAAAAIFFGHGDLG